MPIINNGVSLHELSLSIKKALKSPALQRVWVYAETIDVRQSGGHCYMELIEKDVATDAPIAKMRANIWANVYRALQPTFETATGQRFVSGLKVLVQVDVTFHEVFGLSLNIVNIDPTYTIGDMARRRAEILERLSHDGVIDMNKEIEWNVPTQRIAIISAEGAAGYGDFMNQINHNEQGFVFYTKLYGAVMQGVNTVPSVMSALYRINEDAEHFDCVVIIRGGGATSDLASFDNYDLASAVAQFPLPIIVGIGHERDVTVLDYVANTRAKTPTAVAAILIDRMQENYDFLCELQSSICDIANRIVTDNNSLLSRIAGVVPYLTQIKINDARNEVANINTNYKHAADNILHTARNTISSYIEHIPLLADAQCRNKSNELMNIANAISSMPAQILNNTRTKISNLEMLVSVLSPQAVLNRGYSITRVNGHTITDASLLSNGDNIVTEFKNGSIESTVNKIDNKIYNNNGK